MGKERSRFADYFVYLAVRFVVCVIQTLSYEAACKAARGLAWLAYRVDKRHRLLKTSRPFIAIFAIS
jgi:lauroyl/myristoyl acyltransferase